MAYTSYADFAEKLMQTPKPQGNMFTGTFVDNPDAAAYYADPFRKQNSIDEAMKAKKAEEDAAALELLRKQGMLSSGGGGEGGTQDQGRNYYAELEDEIGVVAAREVQEDNNKIVHDIIMALVPNPLATVSSILDSLFGPSQADIDAATVSDAAANAAAAATGNYGSIGDFGGVGPDVGGGPTGDNGVSGAANEGSHSADGNNPGMYKGGKVTKKHLTGMNPTGPDDGYVALQDGEYVISKKAVDKYGIGMLSQINSGKFPKKSK